MGKLTERQKKFAEGLARGLKEREAAIGAGYAPKSAAVQASRMMGNGAIMAYRNELQKRLFESAGVNEGWIGLQYLEIFDRCMMAKEHLSWDSEKKAWVPDGTWVFDWKGAIAALDALADRIGFRKPQETGGGGESFEEWLSKQNGGGRL